MLNGSLFDANTAQISADGLYRYILTRRWGAGPHLTICMLNPSTADATEDDPTVRRCITFAKREHYQAIQVVNLYAYRETSPQKLKDAERAGIDIIGPENDEHIIRSVILGSRDVLCAWGNNCPSTRWWTVPTKMLANGAKLYCLGTTQKLQPMHPLYLPHNKPLQEWRP